MYHTIRMSPQRVAAVCAGAILSLTRLRAAQALPPNPIACKQHLTLETSNFERAKLKALQVCETKKRKGTLPANTICKTETTAAAAIATALTKLQTNVVKYCTGVTLTQMGFDGTGVGANPVLAKTCSAGDRPTEACQRESECPGQCQGGEKYEQSCTFNSSCQNHACVHAKCVGGSAPNVACDTDATKAACETAGGECPWKTTCDGGSSGNLGVCVGGPTPTKNCAAKSDCGAGGVCDNGCNTGHLEDCVAGYCLEAMCSGNKDCGICTSGAFINHACTTATEVTDCGKVCTGGTNDGTPCKNAATDCTGGGTCTSGAGTCTPGTCDTATGLCTAGAAHVRSANICTPVDRCPNFENNKFTDVSTCDGDATHNGKFCASDADCGTGACHNGCNFALTTSGDVANCLACIGEASVDQVNTVLSGDLKPFAKSCVGGGTPFIPCSSDTDCSALDVHGKAGKCKLNDTKLETCRQAVAKAGATFFDTKRNKLQACESKLIKGGAGAPVSCPDTATTTAIATAQAKFEKDIRAVCAGKDKAFGGVAAVDLDTLPDSIGQLFDCANLNVPNAGPACAGLSGRQPISTLQDLVTCLECEIEFKVDCTDRIAAPSTGAMLLDSTFKNCNPLCGNSKIDGHCSNDATKVCGSTIDCVSPGTCVPFETCDDGNAVSGDDCPSNCNINSCTASGQHRFLLVTFTTPVGLELSGLTAYIEYPDGTVSIPGSHSDQTVQDSLTVPFDAFSSIVDFDYAVRIAMGANSGAMFPGVAAVVQVDTCSSDYGTCDVGHHCTNSPATSCLVNSDCVLDGTNDQFHCSVESASDVNGNAVSGVSCEVTIF